MDFEALAVAFQIALIGIGGRVLSHCPISKGRMGIYLTHTQFVRDLPPSRCGERKTVPSLSERARPMVLTPRCAPDEDSAGLEDDPVVAYSRRLPRVTGKPDSQSIDRHEVHLIALSRGGESKEQSEWPREY